MGRTNIVIDDALISDVMKATGAPSKRQAVDLALRHVLRQRRTYEKLRALRGQLHWEGDIRVGRRDRK
jgi:Arc/MetJ family transcription regulator